MSSLPCIAIIPAANQVDINRTWEVLWRGPDNFAIPVCAADPDATSATPATHYCMLDMSAQDYEVAVWESLNAGTAPDSVMTPSGDQPCLWGVTLFATSYIAKAEAEAACTGNLTLATTDSRIITGTHPVYPTAVAWLEQTLAGFGLQRVPAD